MFQPYSLMQEHHERYPSGARTIFEKRASVDGCGKDGLICISAEDRDPSHVQSLPTATRISF